MTVSANEEFRCTNKAVRIQWSTLTLQSFKLPERWYVNYSLQNIRLCNWVDTCHMSTRPHDVISQKTVVFKIASLKLNAVFLADRPAASGWLSVILCKASDVTDIEEWAKLEADTAYFHGVATHSIRTSVQTIWVVGEQLKFLTCIAGYRSDLHSSV